ncbi:MAG: LptF/LptG family permease [Alphaproteobacteria bacterium]
MTTRITRYLMFQIAVGVLITTAALTAGVWLTQSLRFVEMIAAHGFGIGLFLRFTGLLLPSFLLFILPIAVFAAVTFTYVKMESDRELVVMRSAGLGPWQLARPALLIAGIAMAIGYALTLYLVPKSYSAFKDLQTALRSQVVSALLREGMFETIRDGITVYVRARRGDNTLHGILVHDSRDADRPVTFLAEDGVLMETEDGPQLVMDRGTRQAVNERGQVAILYFDRYAVDLGRQTSVVPTRWREPRERLLPDLLFPNMSDRNDAFYYVNLVSEAHRRLTAPLAAIGFALIALGAILPNEFSRRATIRPIAMAVSLVILSEVAIIGVSGINASLPVILVLTYGAALAPIIVGLALLQRRRRLVVHGPAVA